MSDVQDEGRTRDKSCHTSIHLELVHHSSQNSCRLAAAERATVAVMVVETVGVTVVARAVGAAVVEEVERGWAKERRSPEETTPSHRRPPSHPRNSLHTCKHRYILIRIYANTFTHCEVECNDSRFVQKDVQDTQVVTIAAS